MFLKIDILLLLVCFVIYLIEFCNAKSIRYNCKYSKNCLRFCRMTNSFIMRWLTSEQLASVFPEGTIVRKPHHRHFPTCQGGNRHHCTTAPQILSFCKFILSTIPNIKCLICLLTVSENILHTQIYNMYDIYII